MMSCRPWAGIRESRLHGHKTGTCGYLMLRMSYLKYFTQYRYDLSSFVCVLPSATEAPQRYRVNANSDGAFQLKTTKSDGQPGRVIWDLQRSALVFEVS